MWSKEICKKFVALLVNKYKEDSTASQSQLMHDAQKQLLDDGDIEANNTRVWRGLSDMRGDLLEAFKTNHLDVYTEIRESKTQGGRNSNRKIKSGMVSPSFATAMPAQAPAHDQSTQEHLLTAVKASHERVAEDPAEGNLVLCDIQGNDRMTPSHNLVEYGAVKHLRGRLYKPVQHTVFVQPSQSLHVIKTKKPKAQPQMAEVSRVIHEEHSSAHRQSSADNSKLSARISELEELVLSQDDVIKTLMIKYEKLSADLNSYLEHATAAAPVVSAPAPAPVPAIVETKSVIDITPTPAAKALVDIVPIMPFAKKPNIVSDLKPEAVKPVKKPKAVVVCLFKREQDRARKALDGKFDLVMLEPDDSGNQIVEHTSNADVVFMMVRFISHAHEDLARKGVDKAKNNGRTVRLCRITGAISALRNIASQELAALTAH